MKASLHLLLSASILIAATAPSRAVDLVISGEDLDTQGPVPVEVHRQEGKDDVVLNGSNPAPQFRYTESNCSASVKFMAVPVNPSLWSYKLEDWRPCYQGQDFDFKFSKNINGVVFTPVPASAVVDVYTIVGNIDGSPQAAQIKDPTLQPGLKVLKGLAASGDYGSVSYVSNEMSIALANAGRTTQARSFRDLAIAAGIDSISKSSTTTPLPPTDYWFGADSTVPVLSDDAKSFVAQYQKSAGLTATGNIDWATLKATSNLASTDITQLDALKRIAIAPFE